jgi:hypothetical protein
MLYRETTAVYSEIYTKHINTRGQNAELCHVNPAGTKSNHWALKR